MNKKKCSSCGKNKEKSEFGRNKARYDGFQSECKICKRQRDLSYYRKNKTTYRLRASKNRGRIKKEVDEYKSENGCLYCEEMDPCCLDLHHHQKNKEACVSNLVRDRANRERVFREIEKCNVVCASCHRKLHAGRKLIPCR